MRETRPKDEGPATTVWLGAGQSGSGDSFARGEAESRSWPSGERGRHAERGSYFLWLVFSRVAARHSGLFSCGWLTFQQASKWITSFASAEIHAQTLNGGSTSACSVSMMRSVCRHQQRLLLMPGAVERFRGQFGLQWSASYSYAHISVGSHRHCSSSMGRRLANVKLWCDNVATVTTTATVM